jgi:hypothetical protein
MITILTVEPQMPGDRKHLLRTTLFPQQTKHDNIIAVALYAGPASHARPCARGDGLLSLVGSAAIVHNILSDDSKSIHRDDHQKTSRRRQGRAGNSGYLYYRLILALSVADIISTGGVVVLSPWARPRGTADVDFGAWGTTATCNVLGMSLHLNQVAGVYSAFLSLYFLLVIRYQKSDEWIEKTWTEPGMHLVAIILPTVTGLVAWSRHLFNPLTIMNGWCYLNDLPNECSDDESVPCQRGEEYTLFSQIAITGMFGVCSLLVLVNFVLLVATVHAQETRMQRYAGSTMNADSNNRERSKQASNRAFAYIGAFFITYVAIIIIKVVVVEETAENRTYHFVLAFFAKSLLPMQGTSQHACGDVAS